MDTGIFRKSSVERVNSPEKLNDYIRVMSPGVWITLATIIIFLLGVVVWGIFGSLPTNVEAGAIASKDGVVCLVTPDKVEQVKVGMPVVIKIGNDKTVNGVVSSVAASPQQKLSTSGDVFETALYFSGFNTGDYFYPVELDASGLADGAYDVSITVDDVKPISFILD